MEVASQPAAGACAEMPRVLETPETWLPSSGFEAMIAYILPGYKRPARQAYRTRAPIPSVDGPRVVR